MVAAARRRRMVVHARRLARLSVSAPGRAPWLAALIGPRRRLRDLAPMAHFPGDDLRDGPRGAQLYVHAHDRSSHGAAHVHCFMRVPAPGTSDRKAVLTHLAAIGLDERGTPCRLIAVNQWVTGDWWQPARRTLALVDAFDFGARTPAGAAGRAVASMLQVFHPELQALLVRRDARLQRQLDRYPDRNVLDDRRIEIVAALPVDLSARLSMLTGS